MNKIFVDLEMHPIPRSFKEERQICTQEIIEIGAVKLNEQNKETDSFCEFVHPAYVQKIYAKFQKLTGITTEDVAEASVLADVLTRLSTGAEKIIPSIPGATATSGRS